MKETEELYKYFAFISYSSKDVAWGKRIHRRLEQYRMPATLCSQHGWKREPMKPIFFAPAEIQPGGLDEELQKRLRDSRHLIVICSPDSARSKWVGREIEYFYQLGRVEQIHFFIVRGTPNSGDEKTECFNPIIHELGIPEILGANIHDKVSRWSYINRERAFVQLITKLLGVEFDTIWNRHRRRLIQRAIEWLVGFILILAAMITIWSTSRPVDVEIALEEEHPNEQLPPITEAVVSIQLDNEIKCDTIHSLSQMARVVNVPPTYLGKEVAVSFRADNYLPLDTVVMLGRMQQLAVRRNPEVFGHIRFHLWNTEKECFVINYKVGLEGDTLCSDADGLIEMQIPLEKQKPYYEVQLATGTAQLNMPCAEAEVVIVNE